MHASVQVSESYFKSYTSSDTCSISISSVSCVSEVICIKFNNSVKEHSS